MAKNHNVQLVHEDTRLTSAWGKLMRIVSDAFADDMVNTPSDLTPALVPDGTMKYVNDLKCTFIYDQTSTLTPDGITIIDSNFGGNWLRQNTDPVNNEWGKQTDWYIDPTNGVDTNPATLALPIKTLAEWHRRTNGIADSIEMYVRLLGNVPQSDSMPSHIGFKNFGKLFIAGTRTAVETGVLTGVTSPNYATNTPTQITAATDWTAHVGRLVYFTESNAWCRIAKNSGGGVAVTTEIVAFNADNSAGYAAPALPVAPGHHYTVYTVSDLPLLYGLVTDSDESSPNTYDWNNILIRDVNIVGYTSGYVPVSIVNSHLNNLTFLRCELTFTQVIGDVKFSLCLSGVGSTYYRDMYVCSTGNYGSYFSLNVHKGGKFWCEGGTQTHMIDCIFTGTTLVCDNNGAISHYSLGFIDCVNPIQVRFGSKYQTDTGSLKTVLWGSGNTGTGINIGASAKLFIEDPTNQLIFTMSAGTQLSVGGSANLLPNLIGAGGGALPVALACNTWATFIANFTGIAFNHNNGAYMGPRVV